MKILRILTIGILAVVVLVLAAFVIAGLTVPETGSYVNEVTINAPAERVWNVITDIERYPEWQTNLARAEVTDAKNWTEYPRDAPQPLKFALASDARPERMEFHYTMGDAFSGQWKGEITTASGGVRLKTIDSYIADGWVTKILIWMFFDYDRFAKDWNNKLKERVEKLNN